MSRNTPSQPDRPRLWNVPYALNPFFTGRAKVLNDLRTALLHEQAVALTDATALAGLGGTGKTQTATAYAYRFREEYQAVFWLRADSDWTFTEDLLTVAALLGTGTQSGRVWGQAIRGVLRWLARHEKWLIVVDNVEEPERVKRWLRPMPNGHLLLTSHGQSPAALGVTHCVELAELLEEEAVRFFYKRTARLDIDPMERKAVGNLAGSLSYFPLALELAGALLAAKGLGAQDYRNQLIGLPVMDRSVPTSAKVCRNVLTSVFKITLAEVEDESPPSAELLRASAFCALNRIPCDFLIKAGQEFGPPLSSVLERARELPSLFDELLEPLTRYGLVQRDPDGRHYGVHPLIQELVKAGLDPEAQRLWADRIVCALQSAFPRPPEETLKSPDEVLGQAHIIIPLVGEGLIATLEVGHLLNRLGTFVQQQVGFSQAEALFTHSLMVFEGALGSRDPQVTESLHHLASRYAEQSRYAEAEKLFKRLLAIREEVYGRDDPGVARSIHGLACVYADQGWYQDAEALLKRASAGGQDGRSAEDPARVTYLNSLARFYHTLKKYAQAEAHYREALALGDDADHPDLPAILNNLGAVYHEKRRYAQAEPFLRRSLALAIKTHVPDHPDLAICLNNMAALYFARRKYTEAEPLYQRALGIRETHLPPDHPDLLTAMENYALLLRKLKRAGDAEALEARAVSIRAQHGMTGQADNQGSALPALRPTDGLLRTLKRAWSGNRGAQRDTAKTSPL